MGSLSRGIFGIAALLLATTPAFPDDGVPIKITNDGTSDILVTVYDMSTTPKRVVVAGQRINGFSSVPISVTAGADGMGHVAWVARSADPSNRLCGQENDIRINNDESVHVHADQQCSES
jgi:hypothetical protein